jgi:hypothetical protein
MADFYTPVRIPRSAFEQLIVRVDKAVGEDTVALVLNEDFPFRALDPVEPTAIDFTNLDIENPSEVVYYLDQLLYFAFESAPQEVIVSWANSDAPELKDEAVERVTYVRENMPNLSELWEAKSGSIIPPIIGFTYESVFLGNSDLRCANVYISAGRIRGDGSPDKTDIVRMRLQLWPSDVRLLIRELEHLWNSHLAEPPGEDNGGGTNGEASLSQG